MMSSPWSEWSNVFLDTFADNGWARVCSAFAFKYVCGSYSDYTIKMLNLLLDADPGLNEKSRAIQIVIGLPYYI